MQSWPLDRKIQVSQARILEWYIHYDENVYVSFSGGKDSTVLLDLARRVSNDIPAVFMDTGLEYPEVREFALSHDNVVQLRPKINFRKVIEEYGYPVISKAVAKRVVEYHRAEQKGTLEQSCAFREFNGDAIKKDGSPSNYNKRKWKFLLDAPFKISNQCCEIMKKKPAHEYERRTGRKAIIGTMASESDARKTVWLHNGCNAFDSRNPVSLPLSFWTEQDILEYIVRFKIPYASVYGEILRDDQGKLYTTGCNRTGCVFCGFGCHLEKEPNRFQRLKETHPQLWEYCMKPWDEGGLGMQEVLDFIGVKYE